MDKHFMLIDCQKNILYITVNETNDILSVFPHHKLEDMLLHQIRRHNTLKELDVSIHEFIKKGGINDVEI